MDIGERAYAAKFMEPAAKERRKLAAERKVLAVALRWYSAINRPRDAFTEVTVAGIWAEYVSHLHELCCVCTLTYVHVPSPSTWQPTADWPVGRAW